MKKVLAFESFLAIMCVSFVAALWKYPFILLALLAGVGIVLIKRSKYKHPYLAFIGAGMGGALCEIIAIYFGAWTYTAPQLIGIPLWLPVLWGNAALFILAMSRSSGE